MFRKKLLNSYTLAEVVIVMLIIAVIVAVSIRITKAKLDKVITYSYYSAYSTLSSVAETMASDIRNKRVDEEYLTLKYFIEDMKLGFRNNVARLRTFFAYNFVPPAYADYGIAYDDYERATSYWTEPTKAYDCMAEHYFNSDICKKATPYSNIYFTVNTPFYVDVKDTFTGGTFAAACWNGGYYLYNTAHYPEGNYFLTPEANCKLNSDLFNQYESGPVTLYHCGTAGSFSNKSSLCSTLQSKGLSCNFGYDISGSDYFDKDEYLNSSYKRSIYPTCGQLISLKAVDWAQRTCGYKDNPGKLAVPICQTSNIFGKAGPTFSDLRSRYAKECRLPDQIGLSDVSNYIYHHGAGMQDISNVAYYVRLNHYTYSGTCYYGAKKCSKTQILGGVGYIGNQPLTKEIYERDPATYREKVVCIDRPCDFFGPYADRYRDLLPDSCNPDPPSGGDGGGGGGGGGGSVDPDEPDEPTPEPDEPDCDLSPANAPCGQELDEESCSYVEKAGFSRDCPEGKTWDETICGCQENDDSFTGNGRKFCELFETYLNKKGGTSVCSGNGITSNTTDFTGKKPDLILRNGIAIYNLSANDAAVIPELKTLDIEESEIMSDEDREILNEQKGYIIYADVDGQNNGDSKLWEDVYPFYITLSGKVIPVFDKTANPEGSGGDSVNHLQMNVVRKRFQQRGLRWVAQGVSFQEAACRSGYIDFRAPYCDGYQIDPGCNINSNNVSSCKLKPIKPIGFFF